MILNRSNKDLSLSRDWIQPEIDQIRTCLFSMIKAVHCERNGIRMICHDDMN
jgi:hypothetical protein